MQWNRWATMFLLAAAAAALSGGTCGGSASSPRRVIGSAIHHDVSAPLRDVRVDPEPSPEAAEEQWIEMPLQIPPRAPRGSSEESQAAAAPPPPAALNGSAAPVPSVTPPVSLDFEGLSDDDNAAIVGFRLTPPDT